MSRFQSNALWPEGVCPGMYGDNISTDTHDTREAAVGVCGGLRREGFGGERQSFPLHVWVSDVQQPPRLPREPYRRRNAGRSKEDREMNLPEGKTCADCVQCRRCCAMFGHIPTDEVCDWHPSRFQAKTAGATT